MADEREVTADDMQAAAERIARRDGITVDDVRERLRAVERSEAFASERSDDGAGSERSVANVLAGERSCALPGCDETFVPKSIRHAYCSRQHRSAAFRARNGDAP